MINGKVIWPAFPHKAGFCIIDDTDAATFEQVKSVYDFLIHRNFPTSKTVWPFIPVNECGIPSTPPSTLRGVTLEDHRYLDYCKMLHSKGYEICLHGASAGNNLRDSTKKAFDFLQKELGRADTFICHSKNADNIYWNDKITSLFPFTILLKSISQHECSGEVISSPYFWGDICYENINQIRLYRTRCINTLKKNPSMPYHCPDRPYVNGWFAATKRSIGDCARKDELDKLIEKNGLTVLYQYLHRYADPNGRNLNRRFVDAAEAILASDAIQIDTVSNFLKRLRIIQGIFCFFHHNHLWIVNTNNHPVTSLQITFDKPTLLKSDRCNIQSAEKTVNITDIPENTMIKIESDKPITLKGQRCFATKGKKTIHQKISNANLFLNLSDSNWHLSDAIRILPDSFFLDAKLSGTGLPLLSKIPAIEELSLLLGQLSIVAREILLKGRSLNSNKYLDASKEIQLENHDNW